MDDKGTQLPRSRAALERLDRAVQRLEGAAGQAHGDLFLAEDLRRARDDYARLDHTTRLVEARLDGVIGRLKFVLEE